MKVASFLRLCELVTWLSLELMGRWHQRRRAGGSVPPLGAPAFLTCVYSNSGGLGVTDWTGSNLSGFMVNLVLQFWDAPSWELVEESGLVNAGDLSYEFSTPLETGRYRALIKRDGATLITSNEMEVGS